MKIKKAVDRIYWRFGGNGNKHPFQVNKDDVEAYNSIKDYVKRTEKQQFHNNELFAKLFIYLYMKILQNDKATVFDSKSRKKIYNLLSKDIESIIEDFTKSLNESETYEFVESIQGEIKHPATLSESERIHNAKLIKEAIKKPENKLKFLGERFENDFVRECLESEINQAIELFG